MYLCKKKDPNEQINNIIYFITSAVGKGCTSGHIFLNPKLSTLDLIRKLESSTFYE